MNYKVIKTANVNKSRAELRKVWLEGNWNIKNMTTNKKGEIRKISRFIAWGRTRIRCRIFPKFNSKNFKPHDGPQREFFNKKELQMSDEARESIGMKYTGSY